MKEEIHPKYYPQAKVICACGNEFTVGSTKPELRVEICSACHPFYTGQEKLVDTEGRVEKFERKRTEAEKRVSEEKKKLAKKQKERARREKEAQERPKTLREMMKKVKEEQRL